MHAWSKKFLIGEVVILAWISDRRKKVDHNCSNDTHSEMLHSLTTFLLPSEAKEISNYYGMGKLT